MAWNPNVPTVTNRVQDDLDAIRENFRHLDQSRIVEMGSNSNGTYVRWENGLQVCWHVLQSTSVSSPVLSTTWAFPARFASDPVVLNFARYTSGSYTYAGSATPYFHFGFVSHTTIRNESVTLAQYRTANAPDFQSGDYVTFSPIAIGRWK